MGCVALKTNQIIQICRRSSESKTGVSWEIKTFANLLIVLITDQRGLWRNCQKTSCFGAQKAERHLVVGGLVHS